MNKFEVASRSLAKAQFQTPGRKDRQAKRNRNRVIRDGCSMLSSDHELLEEIRGSLLNSGVRATKSDVYRAALHALHQLTGDDLIGIIEGLETIKTGRPATTK